MQNVVPRVADDWYIGFHSGLAARFWRAAGAAMAASDTEVVCRVLDLPPGARVLDAPCGDGRLTRGLAARGYDVVGVDLSVPEVEHARRVTARERVPAVYLAGDIRALPDVGPVDGLVSWGNSFGYLLPEDTTRSLAGFARALAPGGRLVLESMTVAESFL